LAPCFQPDRGGAAPNGRAPRSLGERSAPAQAAASVEWPVGSREETPLRARPGRQQSDTAIERAIAAQAFGRWAGQKGS